MSAVTVVARIHPRPGREAEVEALLLEMAEAVRAHEPDCLVYRPHRRSAEPVVFLFYEQYRSMAAFESHRTAAHLADFRRRLKDLLAQPTEVEIYSALAP
jgi:quinol monooxygenase YgiN